MTERVNVVHGSDHLPMVTGDHDLGYIYETHKCDNPFRPIISQILSSTYTVPKALN